MVYETRRLDPARAAGAGGTETVEAFHLRPNRTGLGLTRQSTLRPAPAWRLDAPVKILGGDRRRTG
jgi:hypothetical protein